VFYFSGLFKIVFYLSCLFKIVFYLSCLFKIVFYLSCLFKIVFYLSCLFKIVFYFSGLFKDIHGNYDVAFYIGGIGVLVGTLILFINNIVHCIRTRQENKKINRINNLKFVTSINSTKTNINFRSCRHSTWTNQRRNCGQELRNTRHVKQQEYKMMKKPPWHDMWNNKNG
jgi:hypothetical protein